MRAGRAVTMAEHRLEGVAVVRGVRKRIRKCMSAVWDRKAMQRNIMIKAFKGGKYTMLPKKKIYIYIYKKGKEVLDVERER